MQCRHCKNEIPDELHFSFCGYCGERLVRERKKKDDIKIPTPRKRGQKWYVDLRREGVTVIENTEAEARAKATAIRAGVIAAEGGTHITLRKAIDAYIAARSNILSPSTVRGYITIRNNRFASVMDSDICRISNWQSIINDEALLCSAKTLKNAWGFVRTVLEKNGIAPPEIAMPQVIKQELPWLDYIQIQAFLSAIRGSECEFAALLALHSLRRSELLAITPEKIYDGVIHVRGSMVYNAENRLTHKETNKNTSSRRDIEIMIPRLAELVDEYSGAPDKPYVQCSANTVWAQINRICSQNDLPLVGVHGLRRSFASLAYHLGWSERRTMETGGWSDYKTVHDIYIKLAAADKKADILKMQEYYRSES